MICFLNVSSEKFCTPRITCPLFLPLIALPLSLTYRPSSDDSHTRSSPNPRRPAPPARPTSTADSYCSSCPPSARSPATLDPLAHPYARRQLASPAIRQRRPIAPLVHRVRVQQLRLLAVRLHAVDLRAHQQHLPVRQRELPVPIHAVDLLGVLRLTRRIRANIVGERRRELAGRHLGRHDLLGEVAVDVGHLLPADHSSLLRLPQAVVLVLFLRRQIRGRLVHRVLVEHAVAVRDEQPVFVLDHLQIPSRYAVSTVPYQLSCERIATISWDSATSVV